MDATLQAEKRDGRGKNEARRLRASGRIPAVVYGAETGKAVWSNASRMRSRH